MALANFGEILTDWQFDYDGSERLFERALALSRDLESSYQSAAIRGDWSQVAAYRGAYERGLRLAQEALADFRELENRQRIIEQLVRIGHYHVWSGQVEEAVAPAARGNRTPRSDAASIDDRALHRRLRRARARERRSENARRCCSLSSKPGARRMTSRGRPPMQQRIDVARTAIRECVAPQTFEDVAARAAQLDLRGILSLALAGGAEAISLG